MAKGQNFHSKDGSAAAILEENVYKIMQANKRISSVENITSRFA